ncbi:MAG: hypothetical protein JNL60_05525 [Bacteroidia bacterium]|nr:hypothetical protein [Bacteroidia bacterium]
MAKPNFARMMQVIDETFATRNDPGQISVSPAQQKKLAAIHPSTLSELANDDGPLIWLLLIPTTKEIADAFLSGKITEKELLDKTPIGASYDCIYLCSASTLPEARGKGQTKSLCIKAIKEIAALHPIKTLLVWPFTKEGNILAKKIANQTGLELLVKEK